MSARCVVMSLNVKRRRRARSVAHLSQLLKRSPRRALHLDPNSSTVLSHRSICRCWSQDIRVGVGSHLWLPRSQLGFPFARASGGVSRNPSFLPVRRIDSFELTSCSGSFVEEKRILFAPWREFEWWVGVLENWIRERLIEVVGSKGYRTTTSFNGIVQKKPRG